jgi:hypothetical protein
MVAGCRVPQRFNNVEEGENEGWRRGYGLEDFEDVAREKVLLSKDANGELRVT